MSYVVALGERNNEAYADALTYFNVTGSAARPAIPHLTRMMEDPSSSVNLRARAIYALALIGKDAGPHLARALTNEVQLDRETVAWGIGYIRNPGTDSTTIVQALVRSLRDQNTGIAKESAVALGVLATGKDLAIPALVASLQDSRPPVQKAAIIALGRFGEKAEAAIPHLAPMMGDTNLANNLRQDAIHTLGLIGKEAVPPLLSASTNQAQLDRGDVLLSLASIQDLGTNTVTIVRVLIQSLTDPDVSVASISARSLGNLRAEPDIAVPALVQSLKDSRDAVRWEAVLALAGFRGPAKEAVRDLRLMLNDPNESIRVCVTNALEAISQPDWSGK
jgi:HEAT repeat protein